MAKKDRDIVTQGLNDMFDSKNVDLMDNIIHSDRRRAGRPLDNTTSDADGKGVKRVAKNPGSSIVANTTSSKAVKTTGSNTRGASGLMQRTLLELLNQPYSSDPEFTVTSIRVETEVLERLGLVSSLTGQAKQEIISTALKEYFEKVGK